MKRLRIGLWVLVLLALVGLGAASLWQYFQPRPEPLAVVKSSGESLIKAEFSLVRTVDQSAFKGRWMLVFFGYTFCPDICPTTLGSVSFILDELGASADNIAPLFITVDPQRDTAEVMAEYVDAFHPAIVGLTGSPEAIATTAGNFRVFYNRVENEEDPEAYIVDHSGYLYLFDPNGRFVRPFAHGTPPGEIVETIKGLMAGT